MNGCCRYTIKCCFTSFILIVSASHFAEYKVFYIVPSSNASCPQYQHPCLTLSQFAANSNIYIGNDVNISLNLLYGNHSFSVDLNLIHLNKFLITKTSEDDLNVIVECNNQSGRFVIKNTTTVLIKGIHFIGCGRNEISLVDNLLLNDTVFQGIKGSRILYLHTVTNAIVTQSSFLFNHNLEIYTDAVIVTFGSSLTIAGSVISNNRNSFISMFKGVFFCLTNSTIINHIQRSPCVHCIVIETEDCSVSIADSTFNNNTGWILLVHNSNSIIRSSLSIINTTFTNNNDMLISTYGQSAVNITNGSFVNNTSDSLVSQLITIDIECDSPLFITGTNFINNNMAIIISYMVCSKCMNGILVSNTFIRNHNSAICGISLDHCKLNIGNNEATTTLTISNSVFKGNYFLFPPLNVPYYKNEIIDMYGISLLQIINNSFNQNGGTFSIALSTVSFSNTIFIKSEPGNEFKPGGAITSYQSNIVFSGINSLLNNAARQGGAVLATESMITIYGEVIIANNTAKNGSGGGIYLELSILEIKGKCIISSNHAMLSGGGIFASSSRINIHCSTKWSESLQFLNNTAEIAGGGAYLEVNPRITLSLDDITGEDMPTKMPLFFSNNHAKYGGAVYVSDETSSIPCSSKKDCFIQSLNGYIDQKTVIFSGNTASASGSNLFGGLLDRCIPSTHAGDTIMNRSTDGLAYLSIFSANISVDSISSLPVRICFCSGSMQPDCNYSLPLVQIRKGETFFVPLVAVDQVNHTVDANITTEIISHEVGLGEGQQIQEIKSNCSNLKLNIFSPNDFETLNLYADGPCQGIGPSIKQVHIHFLECTCSIGFIPSNNITSCECTCNPKLFPRYIKGCNNKTNSLLREGTNSWITYTNNTDPPGYIIYPYCPFDYCYPPTEAINFGFPNNVDAQCAYNRTGMLCGACHKNLSLSLGSSRCLPCHSHWPVVLAAVLLGSAITGILLIIALLALNMTVAIGLINGIIFYANIVAAIHGVVFPSTKPSFPTVLVAWLNLDIGFDVCLFDGINMYAKTWLQLAFPAYIIFLLVLIIKISEYSPRFTRLLGPGKRDTIATLATLTLLSYTKLLSTIIAILSFASLKFPDGSQRSVWLPDGNVKYFRGKHIALGINAILIILVGIPYTLLLFLWQWLVKLPAIRIILKWTMDTRLNAIVTTYNAPYIDEHRYWTGLLLLVRVFLYTTATITESSYPQIPLLVTSILIGCLLFLKGIFGRLYKSVLVDCLETVVLLNLLSFTVFSLFQFKANSMKQIVAAHISTGITFLLFMGAIVYHGFLVCVKKQTPAPDEVDRPQIACVTTQKVTHSSLALSEAENVDNDLNVDDIIQFSCRNNISASAPCNYQENSLTQPLLKEHLETRSQNLCKD